MSATNSTTNYQLPQFIQTDKPSWLGDINGAMRDIDTQMKTNADGVAANASDIDELQDNVTTLSQPITSTRIENSAITTAKIADGGVTTVKIADDSVTSAKIADGEITTAKIADTAVTSAKIDAGAITTSKIADSAVTGDKINFTTINRQVKTGIIEANGSLTITNVTGKDAFIVAGRTVSNAYDLFFIDSVGGVTHISGTNSFTCSSDSSNRTVTITSSLGVSSSVIGMFEV